MVIFDGKKAYISYNDLKYLIKMSYTIDSLVIKELNILIENQLKLLNDYKVINNFVKVENEVLIDFLKNTDKVLKYSDIKNMDEDERIKLMNKYLMEAEDLREVKNFYSKIELKVLEEKIFVLDHKYIDLLMNKAFNLEPYFYDNIKDEEDAKKLLK